MQGWGRSAITTAACTLAISGLGDQPAAGVAFSGNPGSTNVQIKTVADDDRTETRAILRLLQEMNLRWNQHDIDGFMSFCWHSDELVAVIDREIFIGWDALYRSYAKGYSDRNAMGFISFTRIEVKRFQCDLAAVIIWWELEYTPRRTEVIGTSTMNLRKIS